MGSCGEDEMKQKYAIVIVTYNRVQLLRECVAHVKAQTRQADSIIIVDNASTDETGEYLLRLEKENNIEIVRLLQNMGGAGGFAAGMQHALQKNVDCMLLIDDDAMPAADYMEKILAARSCSSQYRAFAGAVKSGGRISTSHRADLRKAGLLSVNIPEKNYQGASFVCDIASFCGMVVDTELVRLIGLPRAEYFIWFDDTEYSLRIHRYSRFLVITDADIDHKTEQEIYSRPRRYGWKDYYAVRNRLLMVKEHGNILNRVINLAHMFLHIMFRNWLFGLIRRDHYDWKYERNLVKAAWKDSRRERLHNIVMERPQPEQDIAFDALPAPQNRII